VTAGLRVVGAGLGRTGTTSLKVALERLLGGPCYHMFEVFQRPAHVEAWNRAGQGDLPDWDELYDGFVATVDWPAASFWPELTAAYPDALVLLSTRDSPETWWRSASATIFKATAEADRSPFTSMWASITAARFTERWQEADEAMAAYERHNAAVRAGVDPGRLLEWQPGDGWAPLCERLGVPVPDDEFPRENTTAQWEARRS
jgi:hypothetical protein